MYSSQNLDMCHKCMCRQLLTIILQYCNTYQILAPLKSWEAQNARAWPLIKGCLLNIYYQSIITNIIYHHFFMPVIFMPSLDFEPAIIMDKNI